MSQQVEVMNEIIRGQSITLDKQTESIRQLRDIVLARNNEVSELRHRMTAIQAAMGRGEYRLAKELADHMTIRTTYERLHEGDYE